MVERPRHVIEKKLASGKVAFFYNVPTKWRRLNCPVQNEPLGTDYAQMKVRADTLNGQFDEWDQARKGKPVTGGTMTPKYGSVDWLFREYKISRAYWTRSPNARGATTSGQWTRSATSGRRPVTGSEIALLKRSVLVLPTSCTTSS